LKAGSVLRALVRSRSYPILEVDAMVLDPTASSVQTNIRTERPSSYTTETRPGKATAERPEAGQTSEANPAVVANISAAALEASRAATPPEQSADEERAADAVRNADRGQDRAAQREEMSEREAVAESRRQRIDILA